MSNLEQTAIGVSVLAIVVMFVVILAAIVVISKYDKENAQLQAELTHRYNLYAELFHKFTKLSDSYSKLIISHAALRRLARGTPEARMDEWLRNAQEDQATRPLDADPPA